MAILPVGIGSAEEGGYQIERSLRFDSSASASLSRTPASAGNRETWTWSGWVKRSALNGTRPLFGVVAGSCGDLVTRLQFDTSNRLIFQDFAACGTIYFNLITTQVFRDVSAWFHVVAVVDTTQATSTNRVKLYINGSQVTDFGTAVYPLTVGHDTAWNSTPLGHYIGREGDPNYFNGYLTEINFIDGQALDPTSFGEFNATTGVWQPIEYTGSYGTNGFYLNFSDNSGVTAATLGADSSGNGNNWTPNGFVVSPVTSANNDSLVDTPTPYGTDTGVGGEVRGNYATFNPLGTNNIATFANGNLDTVTGSGASTVGATFGMTTSKWYAEFVCTAKTSTNMGVAIVRADTFDGDNQADEGTNIGYMYLNNGSIYHGSSESYGASWSTGDVIGVAFDADTRYVTFYVNGASQGAYTRIASENAAGFSWLMAVSEGQGSATASFTANFGQRPFAYTAPSGFKALCTQNLPESEATIPNGGEYFNAVEYTGNNTANAISGVGFQPDMLWIKRTDAAQTFSNGVFDAVRGRSKSVITNLTIGEQTSTSTNDLVSFDGDGFTLGPSSQVSVNDNTGTYVAWCWKANGAGSSNTDGSITSTVSANTDSGFSIVTYTGTGSAGTVGHGLSVAPSMIIVKNRDSSTDWHTFHASLGPTKYLKLNLTSGEGTASSVWDNTAPTDSVFSIAVDGNNNGSGNSIVAYCFAAIPGYSAFGSYTGNGSADGPFVYTGFRPAFVMVKGSSFSSNWIMWDTARDPYNMTVNRLLANGSNANSSGFNYDIDILSSGFKLRAAGEINGNTQTFIYMAFAENPFKIALAR